jgi:hypothetical protein
MAAVVVRVESQELLVDLVEEPGKTTLSMLSAMEQAGRGAQVAPDLHHSLWPHKKKLAHHCNVLRNHTIGRPSCLHALLMPAGMIGFMCSMHGVLDNYPSAPEFCILEAEEALSTAGCEVCGIRI